MPFDQRVLDRANRRQLPRLRAEPRGIDAALVGKRGSRTREVVLRGGWRAVEFHPRQSQGAFVEQPPRRVPVKRCPDGRREAPWLAKTLAAALVEVDQRFPRRIELRRVVTVVLLGRHAFCGRRRGRYNNRALPQPGDWHSDKRGIDLRRDRSLETPDLDA